MINFLQEPSTHFRCRNSTIENQCCYIPTGTVIFAPPDQRLFVGAIRPGDSEAATLSGREKLTKSRGLNDGKIWLQQRTSDFKGLSQKSRWKNAINYFVKSLTSREIQENVSMPLTLVYGWKTRRFLSFSSSFPILESKTIFSSDSRKEKVTKACTADSLLLCTLAILGCGEKERENACNKYLECKGLCLGSCVFSNCW